MKKIKYYFYMLLLPALAATFMTCEDQVMNKTDLKYETADILWDVPAYIQGLADHCMYGGTNEDHDNKGIPAGERGLLNHCEESFGSITVVYDNFQVDYPDAGLFWENVDRWSYTNIRSINMFLENRDKFTPRLAEKDRQDYIGQMLTLRAWLYFDMVRVYGGVPLILHAQRLDEELEVPRAKTSECMAQIIQDLDEAIAIPDEYFPVVKRDDANFGRINKAVALALKGRILLTYASPQFSYRTPAGTKPAEQRWNEAYAACREAKDRLAAAGYGLFRPNPASPEEAIRNYHDMFLSAENEMNEEMIWVRRYSGDPSNPYDKNFRPATSYGDGYFTTVEFANAFGKADGTPYTGLAVDYSKDAGRTLGDVTQPGNTPGDGITGVAFWQNREPRFYATIAYNGSRWPLVRKEQNSLPADVAGGRLQHQWIFKQTAEHNPFDQADNATNSRGQGLLIRKFADETRDYSIPNTVCGTDWPLIRYAEVLLNLAEAAAKTGHASEAYEALDAIRKRAGIPQGNNFYGLGRPTDNALIAAILHERAVELAFESFRFYDVRRWRQFTDDLVPGTTTLYGSRLNGLRRHAIKAALKKDGAAGSRDDKIEAANAILALGEPSGSQAATDKYFELFYHEVMLYDSQAFRYNPERQDFLRIPYSHIKSNPAIVQTAGWTDDRGPGTFDPYE
jgi:hypothetical protein